MGEAEQRKRTLYAYNVNMTSEAVHTSRRRVRRGSLEDHDALRRQIVEAAFTIQAKEGVSALTMRRVAAELGLSPMALYRYFASKQLLLGAMWEQVLTEAQSFVRERMSPERTARGRLRASLEGFVDYWEAHPDHFVLVFTSPESADELAGDTPLKRSEPYRNAIQLGTSLMEDLATEIGGDPGRAGLARDLRMALLVGYLHARLVNRRWPWGDFDALRDASLNAIAAGIEACLLDSRQRHGTARRKG